DVRHPGRAEGVLDETAQVRIPLDDVNLLAPQLLDHRLDPDPPGAHAGPDGIHPVIPAPDRDLGALPRLPGRGPDLHHAVPDLGNLQLEKTLEEPRMAAGEDHLGAPGRLAHLGDVALEALAPVVIVPR